MIGFVQATALERDENFISVYESIKKFVTVLIFIIFIFSQMFFKFAIKRCVFRHV